MEGTVLGLGGSRVSGSCSGGWGTPPQRDNQNRQGYLGHSQGWAAVLAHQTIKDSKSRVPGTCPRTQSSKVTRGSQSPQPVSSRGAGRGNL